MVLLLIVKPTQFYFLNVFSNDIFVVADGLNPNKFKLAVDFFFDFSSDMISSFFCGVGSVENGHLIFLSVDKGNKISQAAVSALLSDRVTLLIFIIEKIAREGNIVVWM